MELGIGISIIAVLVAALSASYTKRAFDEARKANKVSREANEIAKNQALRTDRLALYNLMRDFALYCSRYNTHLSLGNRDGSRDLMIELDRFKEASERLGPLGIDESKDILRRMRGNAEEMQRLIDRIQAASLIHGSLSTKMLKIIYRIFRNGLPSDVKTSSKCLSHT